MDRKILIAEDQPDSRRLLEDILGIFVPHGVRVLSARDGREALDLALQEHPDLLLLDIMMPRMNGIEVCRLVKGDPVLSQAYIIVISAMLQGEVRRQAIQAGADDCVPKPYDIAYLVGLVQSALGIVL